MIYNYHNSISLTNDFARARPATKPTQLTMADSSNPGSILASAVDGEIAKFREKQAEQQKIQQDLQVITSQLMENEMVLQELTLVKDDGTVYKEIGPVLIVQDLSEAKNSVKQRLEFIKDNQKKLQEKLAAGQSSLQQQAQKIQQMQAQLQQATAQAVQAVAQQHAEQ